MLHTYKPYIIFSIILQLTMYQLCSCVMQEDIEVLEDPQSEHDSVFEVVSNPIICVVCI